MAVGSCLLFVVCVLSQQHVSAPPGRVGCGSCTCCHTEIEVTDQTCYLAIARFTDTGPTNPSDDPIMPSARQGGPWSAHCDVTGMTVPGKQTQDEGRKESRPAALTAGTPPLGQPGGDGHWVSQVVTGTLPLGQPGGDGHWVSQVVTGTGSARW